MEDINNASGATGLEAVETKTNELISISELFKKTWNIYRIGVWKFVKVQLAGWLGVLPLVIVFGIFFGFSVLLKGYVGFKLVIILVGLLAVLALFFLVYFVILSQIASYLLIKDFSLEKKIVVLFKEAMPFVGRFFWTSFLAGIFLFLWFLLLIIPGIIYAIFYSFTSWVVIFEGFSGIAAIKRSKELVSGYWWAVLLRYLVIGAAYYIIVFILAIPGGFMGEESMAFKIWNIATTIVQIVLSPFPFIFTYFVYGNLVKIKAANIK